MTNKTIISSQQVLRNQFNNLTSLGCWRWRWRRRREHLDISPNIIFVTTHVSALCSIHFISAVKHRPPAADKTQLKNISSQDPGMKDSWMLMHEWSCKQHQTGVRDEMSYKARSTLLIIISY